MRMQTFNAPNLGWLRWRRCLCGRHVAFGDTYLDLYTSAVAMMEEWRMFFSLSVRGIIGGMIEAAFISFIILYVFGLTYNWLALKKRM